MISRGFRNFANNPDPERQRLNAGQQAQPNNAGAFDVMGQDPGATKQPKDENFWDMLKYNLCPKFKVLSVTFTMWVINIIAFVVLFIMSINDLKTDEFLGISTRKLADAGAKYPYNILHHYQVHRWVIPIFLHANFMHIFFNSVSLFWIGFMVENNIGYLRFFILYMVSGIGGFIFSSCVNDSIGVGASGAIFGLIGILLAHLILNWRAVYESGRMLSIVMIIIMMVLISLSGSDHTDNWGHFGGLLFGVICGMIILNEAKGRAAGSSGKLTFAGWVTVGILISLFSLLITLFFTVTKPNQQI